MHCTLNEAKYSAKCTAIETMDNLFSPAAGYNSTTTISTVHTILHDKIEQETCTKNSIEDAIAADVIPMDVLIALGAEWRDSHGKAFGILRSTSGITSVISSSIFIWMIMRSHDRLSTTQHRLLIGLCISDIIFSLSQSTFNATAPSDNNYYVWNARGNQDTCDAQGFFAALGGLGGLFYNASLNLYFLAVVKYKKSNEFIRAKIEPFLHVATLTVAVSYSIYRLFKKHYNDNGGGNCNWSINDAPHCQGFDVGEIREGFEITCWRGIEGNLTSGISSIALIFIPVLIMIVSLGIIYTAVRKLEKKLARYGIGALRTNLQQQSVSTPQSSGVWGRMTISLIALSTYLKSRTCSCKETNKPVTRSNNVRSQSRAVMYKAFGYTFAWFISYGFFLIRTIISIATGSSPLVLIYLSIIFVPLQGLFNLLIFMYPNIMAAKKSKKRGGETVSWCHAFSTAFWSRGKGGQNQGANISNLRARSTINTHEKKKTKNEDASSDHVTSPMFGRIKKKKRADTPQEEEKCEIQVPYNINPNKTRAMYSATLNSTYAPNIVPSADTTTMCTMNRMKKVDFEENVDAGNNTLSNIVEDSEKDTMRNQDLKEEEMEEIKEENMDTVSVEAVRRISADLKEQKEIMLCDLNK